MMIRWLHFRELLYLFNSLMLSDIQLRYTMDIYKYLVFSSVISPSINLVEISLPYIIVNFQALNSEHV